MNKIKSFFKSERVKSELSAWSLMLFTGAVFGIGAFILGAPWWIIVLIALFGGVAFWTAILVAFFIYWGIVGD